MAEDQKKISWYIYSILLLIVGMLILGGLMLIICSETQYEKSIVYTERLLNDSSQKNKAFVSPSYSLTKDGYSAALLYFTLAIGVILLTILLPRLQSINIGASGVSLNLKDLPEKLDDIIKQNNALQSDSVGEGGYKKKSIGIAPENIRKNFSNLSDAQYEDDPQKGKWGGLSETNDRKLTAEVFPSNIPGLYRVFLTVKSTKTASPLKGVVKFHLHNTFRNPDPIIAAVDNKAVLKLNRVYGAFTVGAEADNGATKLELDLSQIKTFPNDFLEK